MNNNTYEELYRLRMKIEELSDLINILKRRIDNLEGRVNYLENKQ